MAACHACIRAEVERYGGLIAKSTPDGMLVCFGYPQAHEDHAERAVRAALAASTALAELRSRHLTSPLSPRGAIAAGPVVIGDMVGANATAEPAIVGEAPHLAGRLLALAGPGKVVISVGTHGLTGALFDYAEIGPVELRGLAEPIRAFRVLREGAITSRFDALRSAGTRLIGRGEELDLLLRRWRQARTGDGRVVLITGEPGIGKSRLIRALEEELTSEPHDPLCYHCAPHHEDSALYPIRRQLFRAAGIEQDDGSEVRLDKLEALLAHSTEGQAGTVPLFAALLSIAGGERYPPPGLTPQRLKERTLVALLDQLSRRTERRPVLVVFEDLHWIDPTTLELLSMMIDRAPELPMLLVASFRPEFKPPWPSHGYVSTISLGRLNRSEGQALIEEVAKDQALAPGLAEQIVARTDGIPLFIEELTKALLESSLSREAGDLSEPAEPSPKLTIPSTLQASLLARLDRLAGVKEVAQIAA
jgi:hypothetical protein